MFWIYRETDSCTGGETTCPVITPENTTATTTATTTTTSTLAPTAAVTTPLITRARESVCQVLTTACSHDPQSTCDVDNSQPNGYTCRCVGAYAKGADDLCSRCKTGFIPLDNSCVRREMLSHACRPSFLFSLPFLLLLVFLLSK